VSRPTPDLDDARRTEELQAGASPATRRSQAARGGQRGSSGAHFPHPLRYGGVRLPRSVWTRASGPCVRSAKRPWRPLTPWDRRWRIAVSSTYDAGSGSVRGWPTVPAQAS